MVGVPRLRGDLLSLELLKNDTVPLSRKLIVQIQAVVFLMGDARGVGFVSVVWGQGRLILESGEFTPLYQVRSSKFWEVDNLTPFIEQSVSRKEL